MAKGFFTQGVVILLERPVSLDEIAAALSDFEIVGRRDEVEDWAMAGPTLYLNYRPEVNGLVTVDIVDRSWPDDMGSPVDSPLVFGAWSMGYFAPFAYPGNLARAGQQAFHWPEAAATAARHRSFIRIRSSYILGADPDTQVIPNDYDVLREATFVLDVAHAVMGVRGALCYFNPAGEVLMPHKDLSEHLWHNAAQNLPPLDILSNIRVYDIDAQWKMMDTVGLWQLDIPDHEACFTSEIDGDELANFLRNVAVYRMQKGDVLRDDNTVDGPGGMKWRVRSFEQPLTDPNRPTLRWVPENGRALPVVVGFSGRAVEEKKKRWPF